MKLHANAKLTPKQRTAMRQDYLAGMSLTKLAKRYNVDTKTVQKWAHREDPMDRSSAPHRHRFRRGTGLEEAVCSEKGEHPQRGTRRIADELRRHYPSLTRKQVRHILKRNALLVKPQRRQRPPRRHLPVGRHRVQMDIQQLPAVQGGKGYEYKITVVHLRTRIKYSEIHPDYLSETVAAVFVRALDYLPPVRLAWTDNAFEFTMRFSAHPDRKTAFQKVLMSLDIIHGTCKPHSPWQNGIVERSHRTDNEELFGTMRFADPEERRYQLRLWEMYYVSERPHQGLGGLTPLEVYQREYPLHARTRMLAA